MFNKSFLTLLILTFLFLFRNVATAAPVISLSDHDKTAIKKLCFEMTILGVPSFSNQAISNNNLIAFGVEYNAEQRTHWIEGTPMYTSKGHVAAKYVAQAVTEFFGKPIHNQSTTYCHYSGGYYFYQAGDPAGDLRPEDYHIQRSVRQRDGSYLIEANLFDPQTQTFTSGPRLILRKTSHGSESHYIVLSYKR